jgi:hypothetical protein
MRTYNNTTINRHIYEGGEYDEHRDGSITMHPPVREHVPEYEGECYCDGCYLGHWPCFHGRVR